jgi:dinuclear metal center YbgI/SA1388 family protein
MSKIKDIVQHLESIAPLAYQESYDNAGLIVGDAFKEVTNVLITLDVTEEVLEEAISKKCELIVAHHPIIFKGLKKLTGSNYVERTVIKAIKNDIAIYAIHTNLDNVQKGVNKMIADKIGLEELQTLAPKSELLTKLVFFCPIADAEKVREAVFSAGAGKIGDYDSCSYNLEGKGSFKAGENTNPHVGEKGKIHFEEEVRVETIMPNYLVGKVIAAMKAAHPYEEVAYDLYPLNNAWNQVGSGMIGKLQKPMPTKAFLNHLKEALKTEVIRHTKLLKEEVSTIAVCGGSGSFLLNKAMGKRADVFVTGDFKYHQFFDADDKIVIADVGHFESEQFTPELLMNYLGENCKNLNCQITTVNTNPIQYLK